MRAEVLSEEMLTEIWSPAKYDPEWKIAYLKDLQERCKLSHNLIGKWLCGLRSLKRFDLKVLRELEDQLESTTLRNTLREVTHRARFYNSGVPLARFAIDIERSPNPINPDLYTAENISASRDLIESLERAIRLDLEQLTTHGRVGLLLVSAAYYGGLMDIPQLHAFLQLDPSSVSWVSEIPEIRLHLPIRGQPEAEQRQWFPDPTTLAFLSRCAADLIEIRASLAPSSAKLRCIREALSAGGLLAQNRPRSMERLFVLLQMQRQIQLPQLLMNYASRSGYVTHPVLPETWQHVQGNTVSIDGRAREKTNELPNFESDRQEPEWLKKLCKKIRNNQLDLVESDLTPKTHEEVICSWASNLVHGHSFYSSNLIPSTIAPYVRAVGLEIDNLLSVESILEVPPDAIEEIYEVMLEAQPTPSTRRNLAKGLLEFHGYLQKHFDYPPISPYAALGIGKTSMFVDAQILSEEQYRQVLDDISTGALARRTPRLAMVAKIMVIFGFRLGLRRSEALKLLRRDLQLPALSAARAAEARKRHPHLKPLSSAQIKALELPVSLHIRPHSQRSLKTRNSTRTLPLHILLEPEELQLVETLAQLREAEETKQPYSVFLFCIPELQTPWVSEYILLPEIHAAMRRVTGGSDLHFHHLRHSAATWLTFKLATSALGVSKEAKLLFGHHPLTLTRLLEKDRQNREPFYDHEAATRKVIHITSAVLGHASPKTSLLHYVHCMPWLAALCWQWNPDFWPPGHIVAQIAQVSLPTKKEDRSGTELPADIRNMQRIIGRIGIYKRSKIKRPIKRPPKGSDGWALERILKIAVMLTNESYAEDSVNHEWMEFSEDDRLAMLDRARYIQSLGRHRLQGVVSGDRDNPVGLVPRQPKHGGVSGVAGYADRLYDLLGSQDKEKASRVLDDFVERCWSSDTTLRFKVERSEVMDESDQSASEYLWLLSKLGIHLVDITFIIYDDHSRKKTEALWRKVLGKPRMKFSTQAPENRTVENKHLGIRVQLRLTNEDLKTQDINTHSGAALRFLFLMASIDWHFRA